jgi:hypothetical protein
MSKRISKVALRIYGQPLSVPAFVFGQWAAHLAPWGNHHGYRVSHVPTGMSLASFADDMTKKDAIDLARHLHTRMRSTFAFGGQVPDIVDERRLIVEALVGEALAE